MTLVAPGGSGGAYSDSRSRSGGLGSAGALGLVVPDEAYSSSNTEVAFGSSGSSTTLLYTSSLHTSNSPNGCSDLN